MLPPERRIDASQERVAMRSWSRIKPSAPQGRNIMPMPSDNDSLDAARVRVACLRESLQVQEGESVRLVETHISWVLLTGTLAYKLKKPIRLPFLDFTTLAARRHFCEEELRLNRRLAPSLYLDMVEVRDSAAGPTFGGDGPVLDIAVRMRRFPDGALWSEMLAAGSLAPHHIDAMARRLGDFHHAAPVAPPDSDFGSAAAHERIIRRLIAAIGAWVADRALADAQWSALRAWLEGQLQALAPLWETRRREGRVRECHGDLHLANVLQLGVEATAFDGIEFDDELRWIDVLDDIAFLAMDLLAHGQQGLAFRFLNAYLEVAGDHDGLPAMRFHMACRALVRSQVAALREKEGDALRYFQLAAALARGADARLAITHGLPGSGKSFVSQGVLEGAAAIRVRSDVERQRLFGRTYLHPSAQHEPGGKHDSPS